MPNDYRHVLDGIGLVNRRTGETENWRIVRHFPARFGSCLRGVLSSFLQGKNAAKTELKARCTPGFTRGYSYSTPPGLFHLSWGLGSFDDASQGIVEWVSAVHPGLFLFNLSRVVPFVLGVGFM